MWLRRTEERNKSYFVEPTSHHVSMLSAVAILKTSYYEELLRQSVAVFPVSVHFTHETNVALRVAADVFPGLVLSEYRLPDTDGISFLTRMNNLYSEALCILLCTKTDLEWFGPHAVPDGIHVCTERDHLGSVLNQHFLGLMPSVY